MHILFFFLSLIPKITKIKDWGTEHNLDHSQSFYASCVLNGPITHLYTYQKLIYSRIDQHHVTDPD